MGISELLLALLRLYISCHTQINTSCCKRCFYISLTRVLLGPKERELFINVLFLNHKCRTRWICFLTINVCCVSLTVMQENGAPFGWIVRERNSWPSHWNDMLVLLGRGGPPGSLVRCLQRRMLWLLKVAPLYDVMILRSQMLFW